MFMTVSASAPVPVPVFMPVPQNLIQAVIAGVVASKALVWTEFGKLSLACR